MPVHTPRDALNRLCAVRDVTGLKINAINTYVICLSRNTRQDMLAISDITLQHLETFKNLGVVFKRVMEGRIGIRRLAMQTLVYVIFLGFCGNRTGLFKTDKAGNFPICKFSKQAKLEIFQSGNFQIGDCEVLWGPQGPLPPGIHLPRAENSGHGNECKFQCFLY